MAANALPGITTYHWNSPGMSTIHAHPTQYHVSHLDDAEKLINDLTDPNKGYTKVFEEAGVTMIDPSCGACINAGPGASRTKEQVSVSAQNRNFPGRSGPGQVYLASPLTVAASAIFGKIVPPDTLLGPVADAAE